MAKRIHNTSTICTHNEQLKRVRQEKEELKAAAIEVLEFLNKKANRVYRAGETNLAFIVNRLRSGASVAQCRQIIVRKCREWLGNEVMEPFLRPATLFNKTKFEQYLGELTVPKED